MTTKSITPQQAALTEEWLIRRIDEELVREGLPPLSWTDGGGASCPTGWHRNPYLNSGKVAQLTAEVERISRALAAAEAQRDECQKESAAIVEEVIQKLTPRAQGWAKGWINDIVASLPKPQPLVGEKMDMKPDIRSQVRNALLWAQLGWDPCPSKRPDHCARCRIDAALGALDSAPSP